MKNTGLDIEQLQNMCRELGDKLSCQVSITNTKGLIIAASMVEFCNTNSAFALKITTSEIDFFEDQDQLQSTYYLPLHLKDGYLACIYVTAPLDKSKDYAFMAQTCVQATINHNNSIKTEQRIHDFSEIAADWFWETGPDLRFTYISGRVEDILGIRLEDFLGKNRQELYRTKDIFKSPEWVEYLQSLECKKEFLNLNLPWQHPNGSKRSISLSAKPRYDIQGNFLGYRGVGHDITERERLKLVGRCRNDVLELLAKAKPLDQILNVLISAGEAMNPGMLGSILLIDKSGQHLLNGAAPSLPDYYNEAVNGIKIGPGIGSCGTAAYSRERVVVDDIDTHPFWSDYTEITQKAGLKACWSQPIFSSKDQVLGTFGMYYKESRKPNKFELDFIQGAANLAGIAIERSNVQDDLVQHREHLQDLVYEKTIKLKNAIRIAEDANRAKSEFLSGMSHELRTPLNAILGFAQILESDHRTPLHEHQIGFTQQIRKGGEHLLKLINEILDLSKIEAGKITLHIEPLNSNVLIDDCISFSCMLANKQSISLKNKCDPNLPFILSDPLRAKQALLNLLSNAIKYNLINGEVWVDAEKMTTQILRISVHDTGPGIAIEKQPDLFVPFQRLGAETTKIEGTGIGLSLTRRILEEMGASINFESELGKGSHFWIDFQIEEKQADPTENLLIYLDNNPATIALMEGIIDHIPKWSIISAKTAEQGIKLVKEQQPNLIIMDNLFNVSLHSLTEAVNVRDTPFLTLTEEHQGKNSQSYLAKPINIPQLSKALESFNTK